ncbi:MAG: hypothetical protein B5M53_06475 [Candidatus Cloacimonas sp. 4484_209]|nr:MAG: hypothetical protein B5M53_06475 [Candidatus Cloacimonas sp. 4484_209]
MPRNQYLNNDVERWIKKDGIVFLKRIGVKESFVLVDFGCNVGHYTIPAAKIVGENGTVYALDQDESVLSKLMKTALAENLKNIVPVKTSKNLKINLKTASVDVVLLYDILHYFSQEERMSLYKEVYRILKIDGLLSVYPKHNSSDEPLWNLSKLGIDEIAKEIETAGLCFRKKCDRELIHDDYYTNGIIINFKKTEGKNCE